MGIDTYTSAADLSADDRELLAYLLEDEGLDRADQQRIMPRTQQRDLPLSFAQQRLWFLHQLDSGSSAYHLVLAVQLRGPLDPAALARSLAAVVARHESLRTTFVWQDDQPVQVIAPTVDVSLPVVDVPTLPAAEREALLDALVQAQVAPPFDLQTGPLLRAALLRLHDQEHRLILTLHHIISDAWSQRILWRELATFYRGFVQNQAVSLPDLPILYADYAIWQRQWLQGQVVEQQLTYWRQQLAGVAPLDLPTDYPRPPHQSFRGARKPLKLSPALTESLNALSKQADATLFMTLLAAFDVLLYRSSGQTDLAIGTPIAGRTRSELEDLIGCFVNTLVLRTDLAGAPSFTELVARVRTTCLDAYAHQDVPFEVIVEALHPQRDLSHTPLVQVMFTLQNTPRATIELDDLCVESAILPATTAKFDLTLTLSETAQGLVGGFEYRTDLFAPETVTRLAAQFETLLAAIARDPEQRIDRLPLLTAAEQRALAQWNATEASYPHDRGVHQLFAEQARQHPETIALMDGSHTLTYAELDRRANQLAHYLHRLGVGPESLVGVCADRSPDLLVSLLAVLKAGGAYVPLDPAYPAERLQFILDDTQARVILTSSDRRDHLLPRAVQAICLDTDWPVIAQHPVHALSVAIHPAHLAYVIYTSGSTGTPKGVQIPHQALTNFLHAMQHGPGLAATDTLLAVTTVAFDISALELFLPLVVGARVVLVDRETAADGARLVARLATSRATVLQATPATWRMLLAA
ncbi:MAG TPA: condensation domain-containing protein, partial [Herpetosiphonaceae bacterium]